jgi:hypothetical protein
MQQQLVASFTWSNAECFLGWECMVRWSLEFINKFKTNTASIVPIKRIHWDMLGTLEFLIRGQLLLQSCHHPPNFGTTTDTQYQYTLPSHAALHTHHCKAIVQALLAKYLGIPCEHSLPAPPLYQNWQAVLDAFDAAFAEGGDGSVSGHSSTGRGLVAITGAPLKMVKKLSPNDHQIYRTCRYRSNWNVCQFWEKVNDHSITYFLRMHQIFCLLVKIASQGELGQHFKSSHHS